MALIATVGKGMSHTDGISARLFTSLSNVNIRMIDQGSSKINIIKINTLNMKIINALTLS